MSWSKERNLRAGGDSGVAWHVRAAICLGAFSLATVGSLGAATGTAVAARAATSSPPRSAQSTGYLTVILGRALYSKAIACATPQGMMTIDQVVPQLAAMGIGVTAPVIPDRTLETGVNCVSGSLYPSWADLGALRDSDGLTVVSATQDYDNLPTLNTDQQFQSSCGSLAPIIAHGNDRAWGLLAYPNDGYTSEVQASVVSQCFAFGRTYVHANQSDSETTNAESTMTAPWLQATINVGGGRCNDGTQACSNPSGDLPKYTSPTRLASLVNVAGGDWTAMQFYSFVTGAKTTSGSIRWDCTDSNWQEHWTSQYEVYCWNDFLSVMSQIPTDVVVTDPATVAEAWGRVPGPVVTIDSVNPASLSPSTPSTTVTWHAYEDGAYSVLVNAADCNSGTLVASGNYLTGYPPATKPAQLPVVVLASALPIGEDTIRVCLENDAGHIGSAVATVDVGESPPLVTSVSPSTLQTGATGIQVTITGSGFEAGDNTIALDGPGTGVKVTSVTYVNTTTLTAKVTVPRTTVVGAYDVTLTSPDDATGVCSGCFTVAPGPSLISITPNTVRRGHTYTVTLVGQYFAPGATLVGPTGVTFSHLSVSADGTTITATMKVTATAVTGTNLTVTVRNPSSVGSGRGSSACLTIRRS
jgi:hypothetical protein